MRRFSIAKLMILVAVIGANIGFVRYLFSLHADDALNAELLMGLLPVLDSAIIALYRLLGRNRVEVRLRRTEAGSFAIPFVTSSMLAALVAIGLAYTAPQALAGAFNVLARPLRPMFDAFNARSKSMSPYASIPAGIALEITVIAGPFIVFALCVAVPHAMFKVTVTPKDTP